MDYWGILEIAAWAVAALLFLYMLLDALRVNRDYREEQLLSSREGIDELLESGGDQQGGGH